MDMFEAAEILREAALMGTVPAEVRDAIDQLDNDDVLPELEDE